MFGVWYCHELRKIGTPRPMQLVELGPGRGTLVADMLRIIKQIPPGHENLSVHLVEVHTTNMFFEPYFCDYLTQVECKIIVS